MGRHKCSGTVEGGAGRLEHDGIKAESGPLTVTADHTCMGALSKEGVQAAGEGGGRGGTWAWSSINRNA